MDVFRQPNWSRTWSEGVAKQNFAEARLHERLQAEALERLDDYWADRGPKRPLPQRRGDPPPPRPKPMARHQLQLLLQDRDRAKGWFVHKSHPLPGTAGEVQQELERLIRLVNAPITPLDYVQQVVSLCANRKGDLFALRVNDRGRVLSGKAKFQDGSVLSFDGEGVR